MAKQQKSTNQAGSQTSTEDAADDGPKSVEEMNSTRLSVYKKGRDLRNRDLERAKADIGVHGDSEEALEEIAKSEELDGAKAIADEQAKRSDGDQEVPPEQEEPKTAKTDKGQVDAQKVEVVVYGERFMVPKVDVDRAGGIENYQRIRAANMRMQEAATLEQRARQRMREAQELQKKLEEREKRLSERASEPPEQGTEPPEQGAQQKLDDRAAKVQKIVERMYSGDEKEFSAAVEEILASVENRPSLDPDTVAKMVLEQLQSQNNQAEQQTEEDRWQAEQRAQRDEVNKVMASEYADVLNDEVRFDVAQTRFKKLRASPANKGRLLADIAREAGEYARQIQIGSPEHELSRRASEKTQMPRESSARSRAAASPQKDIPSPKSHIERLRRHAGLQR